ncbi:MAG: glycosyltransferase [Desulfobacteraceae bacterium]|jgi:undecaprenyl-phosphate 4-deoxy-4-formamido-L-arabinose transferase
MPIVEKPSLSVVIPVYNEQENLTELIKRCLMTLHSMDLTFELILVDDGSQDRSADMIESAAASNPGEVVGILLNRNYGQHSAVMAGFEASKGDIVVTLDADLQNPPEEIPALVAAIIQGNDVVGSVRQDRQDTTFRKMSSFMVNKGVQKATGVMMTDYGCMLRAYRRNIIDAILMCHERSTFIPVLANSFARNTTEIPVKHNERKAGVSKYNLLKLLSLQYDLLTCMTTFPLRLLSIVGGLVSMAGMGFGFTLIVMRLLFGAAWAADGVFTLFAILFIFIGGQFLALGLLGEYIGRIYNDVRSRPRYFVDRTVRMEK